MFKSIRVGVLDTHEITRYGLCLHLFEQPDITVVGSYGRCDIAMRGVSEDEFDLLLIGHLSEGNDTVGLIRALSIEQSTLRILVLLDQPHLPTAVLLMASGAHGIICKTQPLDSYVTAIRSLANGEFYFCSRLILQATFDMPVGTHAGDGSATRVCLLDRVMLTPQEREVLHLCVAGLTDTQIAAGFTRSVKTINAQKRAAYKKLGLRNDLDLFRRLPLRFS